MIKYAHMTLPALMLALAACSDSSSNDPKTVGMDDLNPPRGLISVTGDKKIQLRWTAGNAEDDFKGFSVFAYKGSIAALAADYSFPKSGLNLAQSGLPRCEKNTKLFEKFGLAANTGSCEGGDASTTASKTTGASLADEEKTVQKLTKVACDEKSDANVSVAAEKPALGEYLCTVSKLADGTTALENGQTYTFFVASIMGTDFDKMSWTSNFVEDTPAPELFKGAVTIETGKMFSLPVEVLTAMVPFGKDKFTTPVNCTDPVCKVNAANDQTAGGIYFGRITSNSYPQRVFISAAPGKGVDLLLRGPQTIDPRTPDVTSDRIPGDQAAESGYVVDGKKYALYGNQVFDLSITKDGKTYFGKIVVGVPSATAADGEVSMPLTVIVQPAAGVRHYFQ